MFKDLLGKLVSQTTLDYLKREFVHTGGAMVLIAAASVVADLSGLADFTEVSWWGVIVNAIRAAGTAGFLGLKRVLKALFFESSYERFTV